MGNGFDQQFCCGACGHNLGPAVAGPPAECPRCGHAAWRLMLVGSDEFPSTPDELDAVGTDGEGRVVAERRDRTDLNTTWTLNTDASDDPFVTVSRREKLSNSHMEQSAAESLAAAYNRAHGTAYAVEPKPKEDYRYEDRVLISERDTPSRIIVQIRHLDDEIIRNVARQGRFAEARSATATVALVRAAVAAKAQIDPKLRSGVVLLLHTPAALGPRVRESIAAHDFGDTGFREVWLAPFREEPFRLL